jgi:hypothetical protein
MDKHPRALAQLRRVPRPCRGVEQRWVGERSIDRRAPEAGALALLVGTGAAAPGVS